MHNETNGNENLILNRTECKIYFNILPAFNLDKIEYNSWTMWKYSLALCLVINL